MLRTSSQKLLPSCRATCIFSQPSRTFYLYSPEPFHPIPGKQPVWQTAKEAVKVVTSGMRVFAHMGAATPSKLLYEMALHGKASMLRNVEVVHVHLDGELEHVKPEYEGIFRDNSMFMGSNVRKAVSEGRADFTPIFLSEVPNLYRRKVMNLDVAMVSVSDPDKHGFCTLGPAVAEARAAVQNSRYIIGLVNKQMPRTFGDGVIHMSHFDVMVDEDHPLPELKKPQITPQEAKIGKYVGQNLVADGATLQMGKRH